MSAKFPSNVTNLLILKAFFRAHEAGPLPNGRWGLKIESEAATVVVSTRSRAEWEEIARRPEALYAVHTALCSRYYAETGGCTRDQRVDTAPLILCRDLGYAEHHSGGYRKADKLQVWRDLQTLCQVWVDVIAHEYKPDRKGRPAKKLFPGCPLWKCDKTSSSEIGLPFAFEFTAGDWFFRREDHDGTPAAAVPPCSLALFRLKPNADKLAIRTGAYLAAIGRMNRYRPHILTISELLESTGLAGKRRRHPRRQAEEVEDALDKLQALGFCYWEPENGSLPWLEQKIRVRWRDEDLEEAEQQARKLARAREKMVPKARPREGTVTR